MMKAIDTEMNCQKCGKKVGVISKTYCGIPHDINTTITCMECLPDVLDEAERRKYDPAVIMRIREWAKGEK